MKWLLIIFGIIALGFIYLNRSYAYFFDYFGSKNLQSPYSQKTLIIESDPTQITSMKKITTIKYVALGDSLTAGVGASDYKNTYPYFISQQLLQHSFEVTLVNLATPGSTTTDILKDQLPKAILENPDYLTLMIGINDVQSIETEQEFKNNYQAILNTLTQKTKAKIYLINIPYLGIKLMIPPYNFLYQWRTERFNQDISILCSDYQVNCIDIYSPTKVPFATDQSLYSVDKFHPSDGGYLFWKQFIDVN